MTENSSTNPTPAGSFRTVDFALWVGVTAILLTAYSAAEWGFARHLQGIESSAVLDGAALPGRIRIWTAREPASVGWMFKRFYDIEERAEFDRDVLRDLLGVGESYDFWALWAFNFDTGKPFEFDRGACRVAVRTSSGAIEEVPIASSVASSASSADRAYLPVSLGWAIPMGGSEGKASLPPGTAKKWLVAFARPVAPDAIEGIGIQRQDGSPIDLAAQDVPSRKVEDFLSRPRDEDFPGAR